MSESEDLESLKVTELQNELKKRGLDTKGRKAELITRLREAMNNNTEIGVTSEVNPDSNDEESAPPVVKDDTSSPSSPIEDDDEDDGQVQPLPESVTNTIESENPPTEEMDSTSNKKRRLTDEEDEEGEKENDEGEDSKIEKMQDEDMENDELSKQRRKKKSRWGSEQDEDESPEKQISTKRASDDEDNLDNSSTTSSNRHRDRDHHRSSRHDDDRHYSSRRSERSPEKEIPLPEEEIVQFNPDDVVLDFYTSDLNLTFATDCLSASNKSNDALCFLWAGTRATYGFKQGKICYEIRVTEIIDCPHMPDSEKEKYGIRIGWSNLYSGIHALQLGEFNDSFAYTYAGKKMSKLNDELSEDTYGESFGLSDVIGCYIDLDGNEEEEKDKIRISFTKNGQDYGQAFELDKKNFSNENDENRFVFYPHILVKNVKFECNFGQVETPWSETKNEYTFSQNIPLNERIRSSDVVPEKSDCQVILLSGLNGSGKTTWAKKYIQENPAKNFNLINVEYVLSKMAIDGKLPTIKDRNDALMLRINVCLQKLIEIAAQRRRNYIIDHVNLSRDTQSKRQRLFTGYHRIGVVIVPDDDELRTRIEKVERSESISIPSQWIREAKAKFHFQQKISSLEDVIYPELSYEDAKTLYDKARRDYEQHRSSSSRYDRHDDYRSSRNDRNRYDDRDRGSRDRDRDRDRYNRSRSRERGSRDRDRDRDRDRRTSREDSRYSSSRRNDNYGGGGHSNNYRGGGYSRGGGGYSDYRQDSRNNNYNQRGGFHEGGYHGRGGGGGGGGNNYNNNQSNDGWRGGFHGQQRNEYGGGGSGSGGHRGRGDFRGGNQYNNRGSYHDNKRGGGGGGSGGFRSDYNNQQRGRQFNDYENNSQHQSGGSGSGGYMQNNNNNNNNFNQHHDRQGFGNRSSMQQQQQQQNSFQNQQRPQPLLQNPPSQQQQQFPSQQPTMNNPAANLSLQAQNQLNLNPTGAQQPNSLDSWFALYAAALNPQAAQQQQQQQQQQPQQQIQPQQDANSITQQWSQWLKTAQMSQAAQQQQQAQPQLTVQQPDPQQQQAQIPDATALYYQAYYAQLAAAQQQAAAAAAAAATGSTNGAIAPPGSNDK